MRPLCESVARDESGGQRAGRREEGGKEGEGEGEGEGGREICGIFERVSGAIIAGMLPMKQKRGAKLDVD